MPSPRVVPSPMEPEDPILDPLVHLGFVAAATERLLLATGIIILPQRNPLVLAKQAATLDVLSGGRLLLGIGAGYLEPEMTAIGVPMAGRGTRTDDHLAAMRAIWTQPGPVEHHGPFVDFAGVDAHPRPVTPGGPRIVVGGHTPAAYRRAVTSGHGWYGFGLTPEQTVACLAGLREAADQVERSAGLGTLELSVTPRRRLDPEALDAFTTRRGRPPRPQHRQRPQPRRRRAAPASRSGPWPADRRGRSTRRSAHAREGRGLLERPDVIVDARWPVYIVSTDRCDAPLARQRSTWRAKRSASFGSHVTRPSMPMPSADRPAASAAVLDGAQRVVEVIAGSDLREPSVGEPADASVRGVGRSADPDRDGPLDRQGCQPRPGHDVERPLERRRTAWSTSARSSSICSSRRRPRRSKRWPRASYSTGFQPTPTPKRNRPPVRRSTSAACLAARAVWRCGRMITPVTSSRSVSAARYPNITRGSWKVVVDVVGPGPGGVHRGISPEHVVVGEDVVVAEVGDRLPVRPHGTDVTAQLGLREDDPDPHGCASAREHGEVALTAEHGGPGLLVAVAGVVGHHQRLEDVPHAEVVDRRRHAARWWEACAGRTGARRCLPRRRAGGRQPPPTARAPRPAVRAATPGCPGRATRRPPDHRRSEPPRAHRRQSVLP